ncbi:MAG TPA: ribosome maturation factor RimM [Polyangiaceae bacterium]
MPLAEVARPHGVRGEVRLQLYNAESDFLLEVDEVLVRLKDGAEHEVSIDAARRADKTILLKLHSVDDRDRADELRGAILCVKRSEFPPLEEGEFYACDVEGSEARVQNTRIGTVTRFVEYPAAFVLLVKKDDGGEIEVPLTDAYVEKIDAEARVVVLSSVDGL